MGSILNKLRTEYKTEYKSEYAVKKYTTPKIYHGGKDYDLSKRWYVYYSYRHPKTGKLVQQPPIYYNINRDFKTKTERLAMLKELRDDVEELLKQGFSPYKEDSDSDNYTVKNALEFALSIKKKTVTERTYKDYESRLGLFLAFLKDRKLDEIDITDLERSNVVDFLNEVLKTSSARNRNNTRAVLSSLFEVLVDQEIIKHNFVDSIKKLKTKVVRNKTYSKNNLENIFTYLKDNEPELLFFIQFVSYNFLRPVEVCRLQVKDINVSEKTLTVRAKNKPLKTKIIPDILIQKLPDLNKFSPEDYLFTPNGIGKWNSKETSRRDYFSKKFTKVKKALGLGPEYTMYSFRHTFITKMYRELRKQHSQIETYDRLMLITGHDSLSGLKNYLKDIDAELPQDYSDLLELI